MYLIIRSAIWLVLLLGAQSVAQKSFNLAQSILSPSHALPGHKCLQSKLCIAEALEVGARLHQASQCSY